MAKRDKSSVLVVGTTSRSRSKKKQVQVEPPSSDLQLVPYDPEHLTYDQIHYPYVTPQHEMPQVDFVDQFYKEGKFVYDKSKEVFNDKIVPAGKLAHELATEIYNDAVLPAGKRAHEISKEFINDTVIPAGKRAHEHIRDTTIPAIINAPVTKKAKSYVKTKFDEGYDLVMNSSFEDKVQAVDNAAGLVVYANEAKSLYEASQPYFTAGSNINLLATLGSPAEIEKKLSDVTSTLKDLVEQREVIKATATSLREQLGDTYWASKYVPDLTGMGLPLTEFQEKIAGVTATESMQTDAVELAQGAQLMLRRKYVKDLIKMKAIDEQIEKFRHEYSDTFANAAAHFQNNAEMYAILAVSAAAATYFLGPRANKMLKEKYPGIHEKMVVIAKGVGKGAHATLAAYDAYKCANAIKDNTIGGSTSGFQLGASAAVAGASLGSAIAPWLVSATGGLAAAPLAVGGAAIAASLPAVGGILGGLGGLGSASMNPSCRRFMRHHWKPFVVAPLRALGVKSGINSMLPSSETNATI